MPSCDKLRSEFDLLVKSKASLSCNSKVYLSSLANNLGKHHYDAGDFREAVSYYQLELELSNELGDKRSVANAHNRLGLCKGEMGEYKEANSHLEKFNEIANFLGDSVLAYQSVLNKGYVELWKAVRKDQNEYFVKAGLKKAENLYLKALKIFKNVKTGMAHSFDDGKEFRSIRFKDWAKMKSDILYALGNLYIENGESTRAVSSYSEALELVQNNDISISHIVLALGLAYKNIGNMAKAKKYLLKNIKLNRMNDHQQDHGISLLHFQSLLKQELKYDESLKIAEDYLKIAKMFKEDKDNLEIAKTTYEDSQKDLRISKIEIPNLENLLNDHENRSLGKLEICNEILEIGRKYNEIGDVKSSHRMFKKGLNLLKHPRNNEEKLINSNFLCEKGSNEMTFKEFEAAASSFKSALLHKKQVCDEFGGDLFLELAFDYLNYGYASYEAKEEPFVLLDIFKKAQESAEKHACYDESIDAISKAINGRAEVLYEIGRHSEANKLIRNLEKRKLQKENDDLLNTTIDTNNKTKCNPEIVKNGEERDLLETEGQKTTEMVFSDSDSDLSTNSTIKTSNESVIKKFNSPFKKDKNESSKDSLNNFKTISSEEFEQITEKLNNLLCVTDETTFRLTEKMINNAFSLSTTQPIKSLNVLNKRTNWLYMNDKKRWKLFDPFASEEIEDYYRHGKVLMFKPTKGYYANKEDYVIDLMPSKSRTGVFIQRNLLTGRKRKIRREIIGKAFNLCGENILKWIIDTWSIKTQTGIKFKVNEQCKEWKDVEKIFTNNFASAKLLKVHRIQNPLLARNYLSKSQHLCATTREMKSGEYLVFHGADWNSISGIVNQGFDIRLNGKHATRYGKGTYFSVSAEYSHGFSKGFEGRRKMVLARIQPGQFTIGKREYPRPPPLDPNNPCGRLYDSTVDDERCPSVFVIFSSDQAYPQYEITYTIADRDKK